MFNGKWNIANGLWIKNFPIDLVIPFTGALKSHKEAGSVNVPVYPKASVELV